MRWWAVVFILLCVCPFTAPFSTFDVAGPHGMAASDTHTGVTAVKLATDDPVVALTPAPVFEAAGFTLAPLAAIFVPAGGSFRPPTAVLRI